MPGLNRMGQELGAGFAHLMTVGISLAVKRGTMRHCPQCKHLRSRHDRRADGSFMD